MKKRKILLSKKHEKSGVDIYLQDNAASNHPEVDSVGTGWSTIVGTTVESTGTEFHTGSKCIMITETEIDSSSSRSRYRFNVIDGKTYDITIWAKADVGNDPKPQAICKFAAWVGFSNWDGNVDVTNTTWEKYTWTLIANITGEAIIRCYPSTIESVIGDKFYLDRISIIEK